MSKGLRIGTPERLRTTSPEADRALQDSLLDALHQADNPTGRRVDQLVNLTGQPVWVNAAGQQVELPSGTRPCLLDGRDDDGPLDFTVDGQAATLKVAGGTPRAVLFLPEPTDKTTYLVDAELAARLPHRDDLYVADSGTIDLDSGDEIRSCLVAVRGHLPPADSDIQLVQFDDFETDGTDHESDPGDTTAG
jgi:hypothetical protein